MPKKATRGGRQGGGAAPKKSAAVAHPTHEPKNPLAVAFGFLVRKSRGALNSGEFARGLGIAGSTLRLVEAGVELLAPRYSYRAAFKLDYEWNRLAAFLTLLQVFHKERTQEESWGVIADKLSYAGDRQLAKLLGAFADYWRSLDAGSDGTDLTPKGYDVSHVERFLQAKEYAGLKNLPTKDDGMWLGDEQALDKAIWRAVRARIGLARPFNVDGVLNALSSPAHLAAIWTPLVVSEWERMHRHELVRAYAIVEDLRGLTESVRDQVFGWFYLSLPQFQGVHVLTRCTPETTEETAGDLYSALAKRLKLETGANAGEIEGMLTRLHVKSCPTELREQLRNWGALRLTDKSLGLKDWPVRNIWLLLRSADDIPIALADNWSVDHKPDEQTIAFNYSWSMTFRLLAALNQVWTKQHAD